MGNGLASTLTKLLLLRSETDRTYYDALSTLWDESSGEITVLRSKISIMRLLQEGKEPRNGNLQYFVGRAYLEGKLVPSADKEKLALAWFFKAAAAGVKESSVALRACEQKYRKTHNRNLPYAQYYLARILLQKNIRNREAGELLQNAAKETNRYAEAEYWLSQCYYFGIGGLQKDHQKAFTYASRAVRNDPSHAQAAYFLGGCYYEGIGVSGDIDKAQQFFSIAEEYGSPEGKKMAEAIKRGKQQTLVSPKLTIEQIEAAVARALERHDEENNKKIIDPIIAAIHDLSLVISAGITSQKQQHQKTLDELDRKTWEYEEKLDNVLQELQKSTESMFQTAFKGKKEQIQECENRLREDFGEANWEKLSQFSRNALITAEILMAPGLPDYSGIVIEVTSALEYELKTRFFTGYQNYLEEKGRSLKDWPAGIRFEVKDDRTRSEQRYVKNNAFYLSTFGFMFNEKKRTDYTNENCNLSQYLKEKIWMEGKAPGEKDFAEFVNNVNVVRYQYRNAAAHGGAIDENKAEACMTSILGRHYKKAVEKIDDTKGLLKLLMSWSSC